MKRKTKVIITKICLFFMLGLIGYLIASELYVWYRRKKNITTQPQLDVLLLYALLFDIIMIFGLPVIIALVWY